jgi:hypothetical protein
MQALSDAGFYDVTRLMQHGHSWHGTAKNAEKIEVQVMIDGNGGVHQKDPDDDTPDAAGPPPTERAGDPNA